MNKEDINAWLSIGSNIAVLAGIIFLAIEIGQNSEQLQLDLVFQTNQKLFENNRDLINSDLNIVYAKALLAPQELTFEEYLKAASYTLNLVNEWEDRFFIYKAGLISDEQWKSHVAENMYWTLGNDFARGVWFANSAVFESEFTDYINTLIPEAPDNGAYEDWVNFRQQF